MRTDIITASPDVSRRISLWRPLNPGPFPPPLTNWFGVVLDWFDRFKWLRETYGLHRSVGALKVMLYIKRWSWANFNYASVPLSISEIQDGKRDANSAALDAGTALSRPTVIEAVEVLQEIGWLNLAKDRETNYHNPHAYCPRIVESPKRKRVLPTDFRGFPAPWQNFFIVPSLLTNLAATTDSDVLLMATMYLMRHQWGFRTELDTFSPVGLTLNELALGRLNRDGHRYDAGTGYRPTSLRTTLDRTLKAWSENDQMPWLVWQTTRGGVSWYLHLEGMEVDVATGEWTGRVTENVPPTDGDEAAETRYGTTPQTKPTTLQTKPTAVSPVTPQTKPTTPQTKPTAVSPVTPQTEPIALQTEPTTPQAKPTTLQTKPIPSGAFIKRSNLDPNLDPNLDQSSSSNVTPANDDDDLRFCLRRVGIKNFKGTHAKIIDRQPRVTAAVVYGWYLKHWSDSKVNDPSVYTAMVLINNDPEDRDQVPEPFATFARLTPDTWSRFAEHAWRDRHHRQDSSIAIHTDEQATYRQWHITYGHLSPDKLPLDLGHEAADRVAQLTPENDLPPDLTVEQGDSPDERRAFTIAGTTLQSDSVWRAALAELQLQMSRPMFDTWVKRTWLAAQEDDTLLIAAPDQAAVTWLADKLTTTTARVLGGILGRRVEVRFVQEQRAGGRV